MYFKCPFPRILLSETPRWLLLFTTTMATTDAPPKIYEDLSPKNAEKLALKLKRQYTGDDKVDVVPNQYMKSDTPYYRKYARRMSKNIGDFSICIYAAFAGGEMLYSFFVARQLSEELKECIEKIKEPFYTSTIVEEVKRRKEEYKAMTKRELSDLKVKRKLPSAETKEFKIAILEADDMVTGFYNAAVDLLYIRHMTTSLNTSIKEMPTGFEKKPGEVIRCGYSISFK